MKIKHEFVGEPGKRGLKIILTPSGKTKFKDQGDLKMLSHQMKIGDSISNRDGCQKVIILIPEGFKFARD